MRKDDNKGFTLIELLIAVIILGIIITPLMLSFLSSYRVNSRSRQVLEATTLAQNEMEIFNSKTVEQLRTLNVYDAGVNPTGYQLTETLSNGKLEFKRVGATNGTATFAFDVYVELDPSRTASTDRFYEQNVNTPLLEMNTIGSKDTAIFVQSIRTLTGSLDADQQAYNYFYNNMLPGCTWTLDVIERNVKRQITLDIEEYVNSGVTYTRVKVKYDYYLNNPSVVSSEYDYFPGAERVIFNNAHQLDDAGNPIDLSSVYLFFAPKFELVSPQKDEIFVNNKDGLSVDIYVVRQELLIDGAIDNSQVEAIPTTYYPKMIICDKLDGGTTKANYYTNLNISGSAIGTEQPVDLVFEDADTSSVENDDSDVVTLTGMKSLNAKETGDRIYEMSVKVYKNGANIATDSPLIELTGTKLE